VLTALVGALAIGLSLLGSGGSILTVPVLHYLLGQPEQAAIGGSLLVVGLIAAFAAIPYALARQIAWRDVLWFGVPGMAGAWLGASVSHGIPGVYLLSGFAAAMFIAAWRMLTAGPLAGSTDTARPRRIAVVAGGLGVGLLSGLVGVGGGFLIVPALVLLAKVPMARAVGTSLAVIAINSFTGFVKYFGVLDANGIELDLPVLLVVAGVGIAGSFAGSRLGRHMPQQALRRIFGAALLALAASIAIDIATRTIV
jgi:uncharacterized membrane protein YfcA